MQSGFRALTRSNMDTCAEKTWQQFRLHTVMEQTNSKQEDVVNVVRIKRGAKIYLFLEFLGRMSVLEHLHSHRLVCWQIVAPGHCTETAFINELQYSVGSRVTAQNGTFLNRDCEERRWTWRENMWSVCFQSVRVIHSTQHEHKHTHQPSITCLYFTLWWAF